MSLSKPFKLELLPLLALEKVLSHMYPMDLFELAMCNSDLVDQFRLAAYCDVVIRSHSAEIKITMKSGGTFKMCIENEAMRYTSEGLTYPVYSHCELRESFELSKGLDIEWYKSYAEDTMYCLAYVTSDSFESESGRFPLLSLPHDFFRCPTRSLELHSYPNYWIDQRISPWRTVNSAERVYLCCEQDNSHNQLLEGSPELGPNALRSVTVSVSHDAEKTQNFDHTMLINYSELSLGGVDNVSSEWFFELNNEHLEIQRCSVSDKDISEFFKRWIDGEFPRLKTMRGILPGLSLSLVTSNVDYFSAESPDGINLVRFSSELYLDGTPKHEQEAFRTVLLCNCRGEMGTLVTTNMISFHFVVWSHPLPPVAAPRGHRLVKAYGYPYYIVTQLVPEVFANDWDVKQDLEGCRMFDAAGCPPFFTNMY